MTTCPSSVNYMHLVDTGRGYIEEKFRRPLPDRLFRGLLARTLPYPGRFPRDFNPVRAAPALQATIAQPIPHRPEAPFPGHARKGQTTGR